MKLFNNLKFISFIMLGWFAISASAQMVNSAYFTESYDHRHIMNPAFAPQRGVIDIPVLSNINIGMNGNFGLGDFLYKYDDPFGEYDLVTFLHKSIDGRRFVDNLPKNLKTKMSLDVPILGFGFYQWGGYNTFGIGMHGNLGIRTNKNLFDFIKNGQSFDGVLRYDMSDTRVDLMSYFDVSLGHSREVTDKLTMGAKYKLLLGIACQKIHYDKLVVEASDDQWIVDANGESVTSVNGLETGTEKGDYLDFGNFEIDPSGISGFGMGLDLGIAYKLLDNITLSASIINLGWINWKNSLVGQAFNEPYIYEGFQNMGRDNDIEDQIESLTDDLEELFKFNDAGKENSTTWLSPTLNVGAEYVLPQYRDLSFGLLSSTTFRSSYTYTEVRGVANISPLSWFDASLSGALSNYGPSWGVMLNFHTNTINFFVATDCVPGEISPQFIPINKLNMNINFGLSFAFGGN